MRMKLRGGESLGTRLVIRLVESKYLHEGQLLVLQEREIRHVPVVNTILYVHFGNSREGKSTSGVGNSCAPHPLNKYLCN